MLDADGETYWIHIQTSLTSPGPPSNSSKAKAIVHAAVPIAAKLPPIAEIVSAVSQHGTDIGRSNGTTSNSDLADGLKISKSMMAGTTDLALLSAYNMAWRLDEFQKNNGIGTVKDVLSELWKKHKIKISKGVASDTRAFKKVIDRVVAYKFLYCGVAWRQVRSLLPNSTLLNVFVAFKNDNPEKFKCLMKAVPI